MASAILRSHGSLSWAIRDREMSDPRQSVEIDYTNWRGERSIRLIHPLRLAFENNEWHSDTQWLLEAVDLAKSEIRTFALASIHSWTPSPDR